MKKKNTYKGKPTENVCLLGPYLRVGKIFDLYRERITVKHNDKDIL